MAQLDKNAQPANHQPIAIAQKRRVAMQGIRSPPVPARHGADRNAAAGGSLGLLGIGDGPANVPALGGSLLIFPITGTLVFTTSGTAARPASAASTCRCC